MYLTLVVVMSQGPAAQAEPQPVGIDVASYQHPNGTAIDWTAVSRSGIRFVFTKATEGTTYTNPHFASDRAGALAQGMGVGSYHYARPTNDPISDAQHYLSVRGTESPRGTLPPVLDLEVTEGQTPAQLSDWAYRWMSYVEAMTGRTPIFYSYVNFIKASMAPDSRLSRFPLWLACYCSGAPDAPAPWNSWLFWQYTSTGRVPGIEGNVDQNRYNGTLLSLQRLALIAPSVASGDLAMTASQNTGSGMVEVHALARGSNFGAFNAHISTVLGEIRDPDSWRLFLAPFGGVDGNDLFALQLRGTGSKRVELHVLSEASGYTTWAAHIALPLDEVNPIEWQFQIGSIGGDRASNLFAIRNQGGASGRVEVHALSAASQYQRFVMHAATVLPPTDGSSVTYLTGDAGYSGDLTAIFRDATASGGMEAHTLTRSSGYSVFSLHQALPIGFNRSRDIQFSLRRYDADASPDLQMYMLAGTHSGRTEMHVLSAHSRYSAWIGHVPTGLSTVDGASFSLDMLP
jgi:lysozyme